MAFYDEPIKKYPVTTQKRNYKVKIVPDYNWCGLSAIVYKENKGFHLHKFRNVSVYDYTVADIARLDFQNKYKYDLIRLSEDAVKDYEDWEDKELKEIDNMEKAVDDFNDWNGKVKSIINN